MQNFSEKVAFIWSVADKLRGVYKQSEYGRVILPLTVIRRLDQVLAPTKAEVLKANQKMQSKSEVIRHRALRKAAGCSFYNTSPFDFEKLLDDPQNLAANLISYNEGFSQNARDIIDNFRFPVQIERMDKSNVLFLVVQKFAAVDLHPDKVSNLEMGYIFEELIRRFSEQSNETAGEHFTPRDVIQLMVNLLFNEDDKGLAAPHILKTLYDPACGTGGMLSVAEEHLYHLNRDAELRVFGQELNPESFAVCKSDMMIKGQDAENIKLGNSFSEDGHQGRTFDYLLSNPPFGVDWSNAAVAVKKEHEQRGMSGRFGPGLPRKNDGSLLFLLHMLSKMNPAEQGGSRLAIVFNGSPLFTGAAGSGESQIRRYLLEHDLLEAIIGLPDCLFYNTGISTYTWIVTNRKSVRRKGKVQLVNGVDLFQKMRKNLGEKRKELGQEHIDQLVQLYGDFQEGPKVKIFENEDFGYRRLTVERPLRLNFKVDAERTAKLEQETAWNNLLKSKKKYPEKVRAEIAQGTELQAAVLMLLSDFDGDEVYKDRAKFRQELKAKIKKAGLKLAAPLKKAIESALSEADEQAEICVDVKGRAEADSNLRDNENVPLVEDINEYMKREVLPYVPDAWVDESKTKTGYEIPFTRHFYEYVPPRPVEVIEAEIFELERELQAQLLEVLS